MSPLHLPLTIEVDERADEIFLLKGQVYLLDDGSSLIVDDRSIFFLILRILFSSQSLVYYH